MCIKNDPICKIGMLTNIQVSPLIPVPIKMVTFQYKEKRETNRMNVMEQLSITIFTLTQNRKFRNKFINDESNEDRTHDICDFPCETLLKHFSSSLSMQTYALK